MRVGWLLATHDENLPDEKKESELRYLQSSMIEQVTMKQSQNEHQDSSETIWEIKWFERGCYSFALNSRNIIEMKSKEQLYLT